MAKTHRSKQQTCSPEYLNVLECYWDGRPQTAMERLSKIIADNPDHPERFKFYRLWIEVLAQQGEKETLKSLVDHLHLLSVLEPEASAVFMSLRGIAYLDIDDFPAAELCYKAVQNIERCDYCNELKFLVSQRLSKSMPYSDLVGRTNQLSDYFHLKIVSLIAHQTKHPHLLDSVVKRASRLIPRSPMFDELKLHTLLEKKSYEKAAEEAKKLVAKYPGNFDYYVYAGYALLNSNQASTAMDVLERAINLGGDNDVDVLSLLIHSYDQVMAQNGNDNQQSRKDRYLTKLSRTLEDIGMMSHATASKEKIASTEPKSWMVKMDQREFFDLREESERAVKRTTRAVHEDASPGDLVFFVANDYRSNKTSGSQSWRLVAVYQVSATPSWHPIDGYLVDMTLISRPEHTIPFDVRFKGTQEIEKGVISLDHDSLDTITAAVKEHNDEGRQVSHLLKEIEKVRLSS